MQSLIQKKYIYLFNTQIMLQTIHTDVRDRSLLEKYTLKIIDYVSAI
jgi:hypothetical protein